MSEVSQLVNFIKEKDDASLDGNSKKAPPGSRVSRGHLWHMLRMQRIQIRIERGNWRSLLSALGIEGPLDHEALMRGGDEIRRLQDRVVELERQLSESQTVTYV